MHKQKNCSYGLDAVDMNEKFHKLTELGAGDFEHLDGSLIDHLKGTSRLLQQWGASTTLQDAGLYHAAYGTAGFSEHMVSINQRDKIAGIIGKAAEEIVYLYCACDREYFWPQFANSNHPEYKDRFTGRLFQPEPHQLREFCELTVANELEIANDNQPFIDQHGQGLYILFKNMNRYLSKHAGLSVGTILGSVS